MITCNMPTPQAWYEYRSELGGATRGTLGLSGLVLLEGERGWGGWGPAGPTSRGVHLTYVLPSHPRQSPSLLRIIKSRPLADIQQVWTYQS